MQIFPHIQSAKNEAPKQKMQAKNSPSDMFSLLLGKITAGGNAKKSSQNKGESTLGILLSKENFAQLGKQGSPKKTAEKIAKSDLGKNTATTATGKTNKNKQEKDEKIAFATSLYMELLAELQIKAGKKSAPKVEAKTDQPKVNAAKLHAAIITELKNFLQEAGLSKDEIKKLTDKLQADKNILSDSFSFDFLREKITKALLKTAQKFSPKSNEETDDLKQNQKTILPKIASHIKGEKVQKESAANAKTNLPIDSKITKTEKITAKTKMQETANLPKSEQGEKANSVQNPAAPKTLTAKQEKAQKLLTQFETRLNRIFGSLGMSEKDSKKLSNEILSDVKEIRLTSEKKTNKPQKTADFAKLSDKIVFEKKQKTDKSPKSAAKEAQQAAKEVKTPKNDFALPNKAAETKKEFVQNTEKMTNQTDKKTNEKRQASEANLANDKFEAKKEPSKNSIELKTAPKTEKTNRVNFNEKQAILDEKQVTRNAKQTTSDEKQPAAEQKNPEAVIENQEETETVNKSLAAAEFVKKQTGKKIHEQDTKNRNLENKTTKTEKAEIGETMQAKMAGDEQGESNPKQENSAADHKSHLHSTETSSTTAKNTSKTEQFRLPSVAHQIEQAAFKNIRPGSQRLILHLNPAELGSVMISLRVTKDKEVQAILRAASPEAAQAIGEQTGQLRQMLENQGLKVARLDVEHDTSFQSDLNFANRQNNPQSDLQKEFAEQFAGKSGKDLAKNARSVTNSDDATNLEHDLQSTLQKENFSSGVDIFA